MSKVYIVFKREILQHDEWRDEVVGVYANKETACEVSNEETLRWFCEYEIKY